MVINGLTDQLAQFQLCRCSGPSSLQTPMLLWFGLSQISDMLML